MNKILLKPADSLLLAAATVLQIAVFCALHVVSFSRLRAWAMPLRPLVRLILRGRDERVVWAIEGTGRRLGVASTCLVRALIVELRFASAARPLRFEVGIRRAGDGALQSHAWIRDGGRVLVGAPVDRDFVPIVSWETAA